MRARSALFLIGVLTARLVASAPESRAETAIDSSLSRLDGRAEGEGAERRPPSGEPVPSATEVPQGPPATRLLGLFAEAVEGGTVVQLRTDGVLPKVGVFVLDDPQRLVLDLVDLRNVETPASFAVGTREVSRIRVGRHPDKVRVVIDAGSAPSPSSPFERVETAARPDGLVVNVGREDRDRMTMAPADSAATPEASADPSGRTKLASGRPPELVALDRAFVLPAFSQSLRGSPPEAAALPAARRLEKESSASSEDIHLDLEAERTRLDPSVPRAIRVSRSWKNELALDSGAGTSKPPDVASSHDWFPRVDGEGLSLAKLHDWDQNSVAVNQIRLRLPDDRIRLTTRFGRSQSNSFLASREAKPQRDPAWFAGRAAMGEAFSQRLDASLWSSGLAKVGAFGSYRRVDPLFEWKDTDTKDPFATSGRSAVETGASFGAGMLGLTLSRIMEETDTGDFRVDHRPSRSGYRAVLSASRDPTTDGGELGLLRFAPGSAWISVTRGSVDPGDATTRDLSFGTSWNGQTSSAMLSFWTSRYESATNVIDWSGSGADLGYGIYRKRWGVYAGIGSQRYRNEQTGDTSLETSLDGYLSLWTQPETLPDVTATLDLNRYDGDYPAFGDVRTDGWSLGTVFDFSKYLSRPRDRVRPHLKAYYALGWSETSDADSDFRHALGASFEIDF